MQDFLKTSTPGGSWAAGVFALVLPTFVTLAYFVWAESFSASVQQTIYSVAKIVQFGFPAFWVCWICR